jgi:hypothetical protein
VVSSESKQQQFVKLLLVIKLNRRNLDEVLSICTALMRDLIQNQINGFICSPNVGTKLPSEIHLPFFFTSSGWNNWFQ